MLQSSKTLRTFSKESSIGGGTQPGGFETQLEQSIKSLSYQRATGVSAKEAARALTGPKALWCSRPAAGTQKPLRAQPSASAPLGHATALSANKNIPVQSAATDWIKMSIPRRARPYTRLISL